MSKIIITFIFNLLLTNIVSGQFLVLDNSMVVDQNHFSFPVIISNSPKTENAASAINDYIQLQSLHKKVSTSKKHLFEDFKKDSKCNYTLYTNSATLLSVKIDTGYPFYYNFNAQNGQLIELNNLLEQKQYSEILTKRIEILKERIDNKIKEIKDEKTREELSNFYKNRINNFYGDFYVKDNNLVLHVGSGDFELKSNNIDPKYNINWEVEFEYLEIEELLSEFGKSLIKGKGDIGKVKLESMRTKFLKGTISGKYPITMVLNLSYDNRLRIYNIDESYYWYDKVGQGLYLIGEKNGDSFSLTTFDFELRKETELFNFELDGTVYIGTWKNLRNEKELDFEAVSYYE